MTTTERIDASDSTAVKVQVLELIDGNSIENYLLLSTLNVLKMPIYKPKTNSSLLSVK